MHKITVASIPYRDVPAYINASDIAFALRKPTQSMQGVAPIKLGEYLLLGVPTIASKGIGDSEEILNQIPGTLLFDHEKPPPSIVINQFIDKVQLIDRNSIRENASKHFTLQNAVKSYCKALKLI